ncbi:MAG: hypothetical protein GY733_18740 [bacterium]|nr:hypothetical protein [bacterium]
METTRTIRDDPRRAASARRVAWLALLGLVTATAGGVLRAASVAPEPGVPDPVAAAMHALEAPLAFAERYPALRFAAYWFSDDVEPHLRAIGVLARSGRPQAAHVLVRVLADPTFPYRFEAGVALTQVPDPVAIDPLALVLEDGDAAIARMAARVLGVVAALLDDELAVDTARSALARALREAPDPALRVAALRGLVSLANEAALFDAFDLGVADPHPLVRCGLLASTPAFLSQPGGARITPAHVRTLLRRSLDEELIDEPLGVFARAVHASRHYSKVAPEAERESDCIDTNQAAMRWLATMGDGQARPALLRAATSSDPELRAAAAFGLARYADDPAHDRVAMALASPWFGVRLAAIEGLGRSKHPRADALLAKVLLEGSRLDRREAAKALAGSFGTSLVLIEAFGDPAVEVRNEAEAALLRSDVVVEKIEAALATASVEAGELHTAEVLKRRKERLEDGLVRWQEERRDAELALVRGLGAPDPHVRVRSARVLSRYGSEESLRLLLASVDAGVEPVAESAALALGLRADTRARETLERAAAHPREDLAVAAIRALGDLRRPQALASLRALEHEGRSPRRDAAVRSAIALLEGLDSAVR